VRFQHKITCVFAAIVGAILFAAYIYLNASLSERVYQETRDMLVNDINAARLYIEKELSTESSPDKIKNVVDKISQAIKNRVTIVSMEGEPLADSEIPESDIGNIENHLERPEVRQAISAGCGMSRRFSTTLKKDMLYAAITFKTPVYNGVIRVSESLSKIQEISAHLRATLIAIFIAAFALIAVGAFFVSLFFTRPLTGIVNDIKEITNENFSGKVIVPPVKEFEDLAGAFNRLLSKLVSLLKDETSSRSRMEAILQSMTDGVMVVDGKGAILFINATFKYLFAVKGDVEGKRPLEVIRNVDVQDTVDLVLKNELSVSMKEINLIMPQKKVLAINAAPVVRDVAVDGAVLVFHDMTELKKLESVRKEFVANVSHELRTPLSSIKGYAETLMDGALKDEKNAGDFVRIIYDDAVRLERLVNDILDLSKLESDRWDLNKRILSLSGVINKTAGHFRAAAAEKDIKITVNIPASIPEVMADEVMLSQIIFNLVDNAVKYTDHSGSVVISAVGNKDHVRVSVSDNGIGIPQEDLPRIFERFYRVDKTRSRELGGTGLGLAIVKHAVQVHGGDVSVESTPGKGSTFSFTLPIYS